MVALLLRIRAMSSIRPTLMIAPLHVLLIAPGDAPSYRQALEQGGYDPEITQVSSLDDLDDALEDEDWDIVIADAAPIPISDVVDVVGEEQPDLPIIAIGQPDEASSADAPSATLPAEDLQNLATTVARVLRDSQPAAPHSEPMIVLPEAQSHVSDGVRMDLGIMPVLAEHLPIGLYQSTPDGRIRSANPALVELLGCDSINEIEDLNLEDAGYPREQFLDQMRRFGFVKDLIIQWTDKKGSTKYTCENAQTVRDADGRVLYYEGTMQDVTEAKTREIQDAEGASRNLVQQKALVELASLPGDDPETWIRRATELAAKHSGCERVLVAMVDKSGKQVHCLDLFTLQNAEHVSERSQPLSAYDFVIDLLETSRCLVVDDVASDNRIRRFNATAYIESNDIGAMLIAPIRRQGRVVGVVSFQHVGGPRKWSASDVDFAASVGDLLALAIEQGERKQAEALLKQSEMRYRVVSDLSSDFAFAIHVHPDGHDRIAWATGAFERMTGYSMDEIDALEGMLSIVHPDYLGEAQAAFSTLMEEGAAHAEFPIVTKSGEAKWFSSRLILTEEADSDLTVIYGCGQDITERKRFEEELVVAREHAEEMARLKGAFLANLSHEIRTPLTGILGFAGLLAEEAEGEAREFAENIKRSGRRLLATLNSVLDLARIEGNSIEELVLDAVDVAAEAGQVVELLETLAEEKGVALLLSVGDEPVHAHVDKACLGRILTNLIENGIKFTKEGEVEVTVHAEGDAVRLTIRDTGIGIAPEFLPHLFDEFRQESVGATREHEGAGLGLAISKRLVGMLGGTIEVESERPGGTTFTVILPAADVEGSATGSGDGVASEKAMEPVIIRPSKEEELPTPASGEDESDELAPDNDSQSSEEARYAVTDIVAAEDVGVEDIASEDASADDVEEADGMEKAGAVFELAEENGQAPAMHGDSLPDVVAADSLPRTSGEQPVLDDRAAVLIVEDNPDTRMLVERILQRTYRVHAVADARSALALMDEHHFDGFVLDINLGGKETGVDILRIARTLPGYENVFAIALTAYALPGDRERFLLAGFNKYVPKPFTRSTLMAALSDGLSVAA